MLLYNRKHTNITYERFGSSYYMKPKVKNTAVFFQRQYTRAPKEEKIAGSGIQFIGCILHDIIEIERTQNIDGTEE